MSIQLVTAALATLMVQSGQQFDLICTNFEAGRVADRVAYPQEGSEHFSFDLDRSLYCVRGFECNELIPLQITDQWLEVRGDNNSTTRFSRIPGMMAVIWTHESGEQLFAAAECTAAPFTPFPSP